MSYRIPRVLSVAPLKLHSVQSSRLDRIGYSTRPKRGPIEAAFLLAAFLAGLEYSTRPKRGPIEALPSLS